MQLDWQLSCMTEVFDNLSPIVSDVQQLDIGASFPLPNKQDDMDPLPLLELFRPFINVQRLLLTANVERYVTYALKQEMASGLLPNAKEIARPLPPPSRPVGRLYENSVAEVRSIPSPASSSSSSLAPSSSPSTPPPIPDVAFSSPTHSPSHSPIPLYQSLPQHRVYTPSPIPQAHALPFIPPPPLPHSLYPHALLAAPNLRYDMTYSHTDFKSQLPPAILVVLGKPATQPPVPSLALRIGGLPWLVPVQPDVRLSPGSAIVTVLDVLNAIYVNLRIAVKPDEYKAMSKSRRAALYDAFERRVGADPVQRAKGLRRIDFLCGRVHAQGLVRAQSRDNIWDVVVY
jgi:hypothetical protein